MPDRAIEAEVLLGDEPVDGSHQWMDETDLNQFRVISPFE